MHQALMDEGSPKSDRFRMTEVIPNYDVCRFFTMFLQIFSVVRRPFAEKRPRGG